MIEVKKHYQSTVPSDRNTHEASGDLFSNALYRKLKSSLKENNIEKLKQEYGSDFPRSGLFIEKKDQKGENTVNLLIPQDTKGTAEERKKRFDDQLQHYVNDIKISENVGQTKIKKAIEAILVQGYSNELLLNYKDGSSEKSINGCDVHNNKLIIDEKSKTIFFEKTIYYKIGDFNKKVDQSSPPDFAMITKYDLTDLNQDGILHQQSDLLVFGQDPIEKQEAIAVKYKDYNYSPAVEPMKGTFDKSILIQSAAENFLVKTAIALKTNNNKDSGNSEIIKNKFIASFSHLFNKEALKLIVDDLTPKLNFDSTFLTTQYQTQYQEITNRLKSFIQFEESVKTFYENTIKIQKSDKNYETQIKELADENIFNGLKKLYKDDSTAIESLDKNKKFLSEKCMLAIKENKGELSSFMKFIYDLLDNIFYKKEKESMKDKISYVKKVLEHNNDPKLHTH